MGGLEPSKSESDSTKRLFGDFWMAGFESMHEARCAKTGMRAATCNFVVAGIVR